MTKKNISANQLDKLIDSLNAALRADRMAITNLVNLRVCCNDKLAAHPTVITGKFDDFLQVGALGLINCVVAELTGEFICVEQDEETGKLIRFRRWNGSDTT